MTLTDEMNMPYSGTYFVQLRPSSNKPILPQGDSLSGIYIMKISHFLNIFILIIAQFLIIYVFRYE